MNLIQPLLLFILYTIPFNFLMQTRISLKYKKYYIIAKTMNSIAFIGVSIFCYYNGINKMNFFPALLLCLIGDVILGFYNAANEREFKEDKVSNRATRANVKEKTPIFIMGLLSFAFGHGYFIYAFSKIQRLTWIDMIVPILAIFITIGLTRMDGMNTGKLTVLITGYSFMVAMLFSKGMHLVLAHFSMQNLLISIGVTLFLISDTFIMFLYFYNKKYEAVHIINLATYYYGMFFISLSLLY